MATPTVQVNLRIPADLYADLTAFARRDERSITAVVVRAIREHITQSNGSATSPSPRKRSRAETEGA